MYSATMEVPHYWTAEQVGWLLDALGSHNRHQARTAALILWRTGLRVSEVLELEWRDLDYSGEPPTLLVRKSKSRRARHGAAASGLGAALYELAGEPVALGKGGGAQHEDGVAAHHRRHPLGGPRRGVSPGMGKRRAGAHSLRHSAARHWLVAGKGPAQRGQPVAWSRQRAGAGRLW